MSLAYRLWSWAIFTEEEEVQLAEDRKYCAARFVWRRRSLRTPNKRVTWEAWWERMFGENYKNYVRAMIEKKEA